LKPAEHPSNILPVNAKIDIDIERHNIIISHSSLLLLLLDTKITKKYITILTGIPSLGAPMLIY
jgi:hypothetical protein